MPPTIDSNGLGLRVPGIVISPYARPGFINHATFSFDSFLKFVEDDFLAGERIDPKTDGRPDKRPTVRENSATLADLRSAFDFAQAPLPPPDAQVAAPTSAQIAAVNKPAPAAAPPTTASSPPLATTTTAKPGHRVERIAVRPSSRHATPYLGIAAGGAALLALLILMVLQYSRHE